MKARAWRWRWIEVVAACVLWGSMGVAQQRAGAPIDGVYKGTLGKEEIVLEAGAEAPKPTDLAITQDLVGRYFYRRHGVAIYMKGEPLKDGSIRLREYQGSKETGAQWRLRFQGDKATGIFCKCEVDNTGLSIGGLKIELVRVSRGFDPDLGQKRLEKPPDEAYYDLLVDFPLHTGAEISINKDLAYRVQDDPRFEAGMPRLTQFPDAGVMSRVNEDLERKLKEDRVWVSDCLVGEERGGSYEEKIEVTVLTEVVFSVVKKRFYYCGGAYPNGEATVLTYNMHTGKRFRLYGFLYDEIHPAKPEKYAAYENPLPMVLTDLYMSHYVLPADLKTEDCDLVMGVDEDGNSRLLATFSRWPDTVIFPGKDGLIVSPVLPHANQGCGPEITIPYKEILPLIAEDSVFRAMIDSIQESEN